MMTWSGAVQVFACLEPTDMRKSFDGLCGVVELGMRRRVETGSMFLFFNRRRDRVKILQAVEDGMVLIYKRLERGTFEMPSCPDGTSGSSFQPGDAGWRPVAAVGWHRPVECPSPQAVAAAAD